jgi:hypothetical protein
MSDFVRLYDSNSDPSDAFLLADGTAVFYVTETDKYNLVGKNVVIGGSELILSRVLSIPVRRMETAVIQKGAAVKRISGDNFIEGLSNFSFILNVSMVAAKQVMLTNQIISVNRKLLKGQEEDRQKVCLDYYRIVSSLKKENEKRRLPWLKEFIVKYETSLIYKEGEAVSRTSEPVVIEASTVLADMLVEFPRDSILCEQGSEGSEMFILQSGVIDVIVGGHSMATISDPGTPIGEIALLIGEKRTATLKARNTVVVTRLRKADLKGVAEKDPSILKSIALSLAKKHYQNTTKLHEISSMIVEKDITLSDEDKSKAARKCFAAKTELGAVRNALGELVFKHNDPFLKEISSRYL